MKFEEALKALREGKRIRHADWYTGAYIKVVHGRVINDLGVEDTLGVNFLLSDEWEVIEPKVTITKRQLLDALDQAIYEDDENRIPSYTHFADSLLKYLGL